MLNILVKMQCRRRDHLSTVKYVREPRLDTWTETTARHVDPRVFTIHSHTIRYKTAAARHAVPVAAQPTLDPRPGTILFPGTLHGDLGYVVGR